MTMESSSPNSLIFSALTLQKPSDLTFITITNPSDFKNSGKQREIRRHARLSANSSKNKRRKNTKLVFNLPDATSQVTTESNDNLALSRNSIQNIETVHEENAEGDASGQLDLFISTGLSLNFLRPIGFGRSVLPLQSFPIASNSRMRHLINFGLNLARFSV
jgi:hypothetical protein